MAAEAKYDMTVHPTSALVRSQSDGSKAHQVTFPSCDCADFINRRGVLIEAEGGIAVTLCKHIAEGLERIGGWNRRPEPEKPKDVLYTVLSRKKAVTVLTSHFISSDLTEHLLLAARGAGGMWVHVDIASGALMAKYEPAHLSYSLRVPASQPLSVPADARFFPAGQLV